MVVAKPRMFLALLQVDFVSVILFRSSRSLDFARFGDFVWLFRILRAVHTIKLNWRTSDMVVSLLSF